MRCFCMSLLRQIAVSFSPTKPAHFHMEREGPGQLSIQLLSSHIGYRGGGVGGGRGGQSPLTFQSGGSLFYSGTLPCYWYYSNASLAMHYAHITIVSRIYTPHFATLVLVKSVRGWVQLVDCSHVTICACDLLLFQHNAFGLQWLCSA